MLQIITRTRAWFSASSWAVALILLAVCAAARLPYFFQSVIDWDESTFILMGQSILDGNLPYLELWENKSPLAFLPFALFIGLFGKSIEAVRLGGMLFVAGAAYLTFLNGNMIWGRRAGLLAGVGCIFFVSTENNGQSTMTEIIAIVPLMGALVLLIAREYTPRVLFGVGFLLGVAGMVRLNLAYTALFVGLYLAFTLWRSDRRNVVAGLSAYAVGGLLPVLATAMPYLLAGHGDVWLRSVFLAPLSHTRAGLNPFGVLTGQLQNGFGIANALLWVGCLLGAGWLATSWNRQTSQQKQSILVIGVFFLGTAWSILVGGRGSKQQYLIQIIPFLSLVAAAFYDQLLATRYRIGVIAVLAVGLLVPAKPVVGKYLFVANRVLAGKAASHGRAYEIAAFLNEHNPERRPVYLMREHIVYWLTETKPLTRITTHPSNISKKYLVEAVVGESASSESEMARVLAFQPLFIVKGKKVWYLKRQVRVRRMLDQELADHYAVVATFGNRQIYERTTE